MTPPRDRLGSALALLGRHRSLVKWAIGSLLGSELVLLAGAALSAHLVGRALTGATTEELAPWTIALALLAPVAVALQASSSYIAHRLSFDSHSDIRRALFDAFERLAPAYFIRRRSGDITSAASEDVELVELFTAHHLPTRVVATLVPLSAALGLLGLHPGLLVALAPFMIVLVVVPTRLRERGDRRGRELRARSGALAADLTDSVQGMREIVSFGAEDLQRRRIERNATLLGEAHVAQGRHAGLDRALTETFVGLGLIAVIGTAAVLVDTGRLGPSAYLVAVVLAAGAFLPLAKVSTTGREMNRVAAAADRVTELLDEPAVVIERPQARRARIVTPRIRFDRVDFRYGPDLPLAVRGITMTIDPGETVALVGASGAGKSTCANLLLRLFDPVSGSITIGGHDLRDLPLRQLPELITHVPQDVYLFNDDVIGNLRIGRTDATTQQVEDAAAHAQAAEFIAALPQGYATQLGERGARLSGGQRQRLAVARAILSRAPVLVMDEAVSNLDTESEVALNRALAEVGRTRTMLIIAHRPSTIRTADRIVVLDQGRVVQTGTHDDLVSTPGPFSTLVRNGTDHPG